MLRIVDDVSRWRVRVELAEIRLHPLLAEMSIFGGNCLLGSDIHGFLTLQSSPF